MASSQWPPGFRFRPTDQELVAFYLARKVSGRSIQAGIITEVDLYKCEPWDLPDKSSFQNDVEWYFFSPRDKKYPNGSRTNRATEAGYWKATGKDRVVRTGSRPVGMKKTLVFYRGRAPHGERTDWIMHEYRLDPVDSRQFQQDAFVLCRVFRKVNAGAKNEEESFPNYLDDELAVCSPLNKPEKDVQPQCVEPEEGQVCSPSPEEGQVCSPSPTEVQVPLLVEENGSPTVIEDDGLNDFLMGLFAADEQVRVVAKEEIQPPCEASKQFVDCEEAPGSGSSPGDGDGYGLGLEQIQQLDVGPDSTDGFNVMDILAGDFFELNDLETADFQTSYDGVALLGQDGESLPSEVTWMNDDIGISFEQSAYGTADEFFQQNLKPVDTTSLTTTEESKHPLKRFLNMLGSVHVLPASAAEFPANFSSSSKLILRGSNSDGGGGSGGGSGGGGGGIHVAAMKVCVTAVTVACRCKKEAAAKEEEVKREKEEEGGERRRILRKWNIDGRLVFVFMLGCISAVVWILLLPAISRVANYVDSLFF